jgi:hypothetical protein
MGKRSRKRDGSPARRPVTPAAPAPAPRARGRRARLDELPPAPWAPFPLVELCVLLGLILLGIGLFAGGDRAIVFVLCGVALSSLAGLEQAIREHFAGFRSHTSLLSGACAIATLAGLTALGLDRPLALAAGVALFAAVFGLFRRAFLRRSGGLSFRA